MQWSVNGHCSTCRTALGNVPANDGSVCLIAARGRDVRLPVTHLHVDAECRLSLPTFPFSVSSSSVSRRVPSWRACVGRAEAAYIVFWCSGGRFPMSDAQTRRPSWASGGSSPTVGRWVRPPPMPAHWKVGEGPSQQATRCPQTRGQLGPSHRVHCAGLRDQYTGLGFRLSPQPGSTVPACGVNDVPDCGGARLCRRQRALGEDHDERRAGSDQRRAHHRAHQVPRRLSLCAEGAVADEWPAAICGGGEGNHEGWSREVISQLILRSSQKYHCA